MSEFNQKKKSKDTLRNLKKLRLSALSCGLCGQCRSPILPSSSIYYVCPINKTQSSLGFEPYYARGKNLLLKGLLEGKLEMTSELGELFFLCTLCGSCETFCHNSFNENIEFPNHKWMDSVNVYEAVRADLVESELSLPSHIAMNKSMVELLNPYERDNEDKLRWTEKLDFKVKDLNKESAENLYFVGCTAALTPQIQNVAITTAKIFNKLGIDFGIFGEREICCGSVAMRTGDRKAFELVSRKNTDLFKEKGIKKIVTSCAGCYRTFKKDYGDTLDDIEIYHTIEFLNDLIDAKSIKLKNLDINTTYHDPCHIGRHMGGELFEIPRKILKKISNFREMKTYREGAMCCGAGGGVKKGFPEFSLEMAENRIKEAINTGAEFLVSSCPFCYRNFTDAIESLNSPLKMRDITELILISL